MHIRNLLYLAIVPALVLSACDRAKDEDPVCPDPEPVSGPVVRLTIHPLWNGTPFDKTQVYMNVADERVLVQLVKFYLADVKLVTGGTEQGLFDADLFNVTNGPVTRFLSVPEGGYDRLRFGLGLPEYLNHADISTIPAEDPLGNNSGMYWTWATMYRFMLFEGRFDTDPDATGTLPFQFSIHTGFDTLYRTTELPLALQVVAGDTAYLDLDVDIARFFTNGNDTLSFAEGAQWHGDVDNLPFGIKAADLQIGAFSME